MTDKKNIHSDASQQDDFDDHFEDNFDDTFNIDESQEETFSPPEEGQFEENQPKETKPEASAGKKSGSSFPVIIGIAILGFLGWKLYGTLMPSVSTKSAPKKTTPANQMNGESSPTPNDVLPSNLSSNAPVSTVVPPHNLPSNTTPPPTSNILSSVPNNVPSNAPVGNVPAASTPVSNVPVSNIPVNDMPELNNAPTNNMPATTTPSNGFPQTEMPPAPAVTLPPAPAATLPSQPVSNAQDLATLNKETDKELQQKVQKEVQSEVTKLSTKLEEQDKLYKQKLDNLEKSLVSNKEQMSSALRSIQQDIKTLSAAMQQINQRQQSQERDEIRRATKSKSPAAPKPQADTLPTLTVYAIIPGRAWLRNNSGQTLTVTEGDPIAEYGKVLKIDASAGVVITTSGVTLR